MNGPQDSRFCKTEETSNAMYGKLFTLMQQYNIEKVITFGTFCDRNIFWEEISHVKKCNHFTVKHDFIDITIDNHAISCYGSTIMSFMCYRSSKIFENLVLKNFHHTWEVIRCLVNLDDKSNQVLLLIWSRGTKFQRRMIYSKALCVLFVLYLSIDKSESLKNVSSSAKRAIHVSDEVFNALVIRDTIKAKLRRPDAEQIGMWILTEYLKPKFNKGALKSYQAFLEDPAWTRHNIMALTNIVFLISQGSNFLHFTVL